jgi:hypothetical protein
MSRNYLFFWFILILVLIPERGFSQETLKFGSTNLSAQSLEFKKIKCHVTPKVVWDTNDRNKLSITLIAKWIDKNGQPAVNAGHYLYMVENPNDFIAKNSKGLEMPDPGSESEFRTQKSPKFTENENEISYLPFKDGYDGFESESEKIILQIEGADNTVITSKFYFAYFFLEGSKKQLIDAGKELKWTFTIPAKPKPGSGCATAVNAYSNKINSVNKKYQTIGIAGVLSKPSVTAAELDIKNKECTAWLESSRKLNDSIANDPGLGSCKDDQDNLLNVLKNITGAAQSDEKLLIQKIAEIKGQPAAAKPTAKTEPEPGKKEPDKAKTVPAASASNAEDIKVITERYQQIYNDLVAEFMLLNTRVNAGQSSIQSRLSSNAQRISDVQAMIDKKSLLTPESQRQMSDELIISISENQDNKDANQFLLDLVRVFKSSIEREKSYCESDFLRLDKKALPAESKKILASLDGIYEKASGLESSLDLVSSEIYKQNADLFRLKNKLQGDEEMSEIMSSFNKSFSSLLSSFSLIKVRINETGDDFESTKFSKQYFQWRKEKLLASVNEINSDYLSLMRSYDSLVKEKNDSFRKFEFDPMITSQEEFEKAEAGFSSRIETLKKTINEWEAMPFPYAKAIISIVIVAILAFGLFIYFRALKKKKVLQTIIKPAAKAQSNIIKIQNSEADKSEKGKGFLKELKSAGNDYLELELFNEWEDTAVTKVYFERKCIIKTYRFFEDSIHSTGGETSANETGGYLIGQWDHDPSNSGKYIVSLEDFIEPGDDASFSKYQLNFGAKIGVKLQSVLDNDRQKTGRDFVLTAWFHSHPGLKIFLSDYDLTVQEDFAGINNKNKMIALVLDPYTPAWDLGIFAYKTNGQMNNAADSKKFFSFDLMYRWALNPKPQSRPQMQPEVQPAPPKITALKPMPSVDNHFSFDVTGMYHGSQVRMLYFSIPAIIELKRFTEDAKLDAGSDLIFARLEGNKYLRSADVTDIIIDNLIREDGRPGINESGERELVGIITCPSARELEHIEEFQEWLRDKVNLADPMDILLLITADKNALLVFTNANLDEIQGTLKGSAAHIFFSELVEWTRKRK